MSRTVLNIGPLLIEESQTRAGKKVYRSFTRNSTNSIATPQQLNKIRLALQRELIRIGIIKPRNREPQRKADRKYKAKNRDTLLQKKREYYREHADEINQKKRLARRREK